MAAGVPGVFVEVGVLVGGVGPLGVLVGVLVIGGGPVGVRVGVLVITGGGVTVEVAQPAPPAPELVARTCTTSACGYRVHDDCHLPTRWHCYTEVFGCGRRCSKVSQVVGCAYVIGIECSQVCRCVYEGCARTSHRVHRYGDTS